MVQIFYIILALLLGAIVGWLLANTRSGSKIQNEKDAALQKYSELEKEHLTHTATTSLQMQTFNEQAGEKEQQIQKLKELSEENVVQINLLNQQNAAATANLGAANKIIADKNELNLSLQNELKEAKAELIKSNQALATATANLSALTEKLQTQQQAIETMNKKFNTEFENIANKILETKSEKFTKLNNDNLKSILDPLGREINDFKKQVDDVYKTESKERFSLANEVKKLAELNQVISQEAKNLTRALKSESKTQGGWGEMILESILERSGLVKDREYFMEQQLVDDNGVPLRSEAEDKKMRPDAVIQYPDNRKVIIDSKVSLNAFTRCIAAENEDDRIGQLNEHILCIKRHIVSLSAKGYDDYNKSLDFVMMFIPSEPAYIAALQADSDLWHFAYDKRILLLSPTNLITSLKLIVDLWKREYQNQNALEIAERGAKLYDKFVGFVTNIDSVGEGLKKAQEKYNEAYKQLSTGNDNLVSQATKLKNLGLKTKKELPREILNTQNDKI